MKQVVSRVEDAEYERFRELTASLGTTAADAIRIFVHSFNEYGGFPYPVRKTIAEPFETEEDATEFAAGYAKRALDEAW